MGKSTQKQGVGNAKLGRAATKEAYKEYKDRGALQLSGDILNNAQKAAESVGAKRRNDMTWEEADNKNTNPNYKKNSPTADNCQACVVVHEARLRGIDVTALPYSEDNNVFVKLCDNFEAAWINPKTNKAPKPMEYRKGTFEQMVSALEKQCSAVGRYHIGLNWENISDSNRIEYGHVLTAERLPNGNFRYFDPQIGEFINIYEYAEYSVQYLESIKIDKLFINTDILKMICGVV
ncbi:MAG: toxin glutamine deamidase domain-containing protein [Muribaculaceae bacterium]